MVERSRLLRITDLGLMAYGEALTLQHALREERLAGRIPDTLLLVEHPPTVTLGRRSQPEELLLDRGALAAMGYGVFEVERGGKATYHGPGQIVGYPIVSVREAGLSVPRYVGLLEQTVIDYLAGLGLKAERRPGYPGVWVRGRKIAAVGVHLKRWVSMHGFALNLAPDLSRFQAIVPCGIAGAEVTSVLAELGEAPPMAEAKGAIAQTFERLFGYERVQWSEALRGLAAAARRNG